LRPNDKCTKANIKVIDVLKRKHPKIWLSETAFTEGDDYEVWTEGIRGFDTYVDGAPATLSTSFDFEVIEKMSSKLHGAAGPGGVDARMLTSPFLLTFDQFRSFCGSSGANGRNGCAMNLRPTQRIELFMQNGKWPWTNSQGLGQWRLERFGCGARERDSSCNQMIRRSLPAAVYNFARALSAESKRVCMQ
jgi:hypothetical protein